MEQEKQEPQYEFGETNVKAKIETPRATQEELVAMARKIYGKVLKSNIKPTDEEGNDKLLETLQAEFKDFNTSFPLVMRWMVQVRKFHVGAFEKFLLKHVSAKLESREDYLTLQAEYLVLLYKAEHPHPDETMIKKYRKSIIEQLMEEDKKFIEMHKQAEEEMKKEDKKVEDDRKQKLFAFLLSQKLAKND